MNRVLVVLAVVGVCVLGGCGGDDHPKLASCSTIYAEGKVITARQVKDGCRLPNGTKLPAQTCEQVNGAVVVTYKRSDPQLWGLVGQRLHSASGGTVDKDPEYVKAVALC